MSLKFFLVEKLECFYIEESSMKYFANLFDYLITMMIYFENALSWIDTHTYKLFSPKLLELTIKLL